MSFAVDKYTQNRERRALILARFSLDDAFEMCPCGGQDFWGDAIEGFCPCCRQPGLVCCEGRFRCQICGAAGDAVAWVMLVQSVSTVRALNLIETWLGRRSL